MTSNVSITTNSNVSISNTVSIEDTLYITPGNSSYSILNQNNITKVNTNSFILNTPYCIRTFSVTNPFNLIFNIKIGDFIFPNFTNDTVNKVATFVLNDYNTIIPHEGNDVYIDNNVYKRIEIVYGSNLNQTLNLNPNYSDIMITGFEFINDEKVPISKVLRKYFAAYTLPLYAPTDSIDIYGKCVLDKNNLYNNIYQIQLSLNNSLYSIINLSTNDNNNLIRIKLSNLDGTYPEGNENNYLSPSINSNTINCSQLQVIDIEFINFSPTSILQNSYTVYSYPNRQPLFTY